MKSSRIFRWIWRVNAILILIVGLGVFGILVYAGYESVKWRREYYASDMVNVEPNVKINSEWSLGGFYKIKGTTFLIASAHEKQNFSIGFGTGSNKETSATRNYLILNSETQETRWITPTNEHLFLGGYNAVTDDSLSRNYDIGNIRYLCFRIVKSDTNQDGRLTEKDKKTFAFSDVSGENFVDVIESFDESLGEHLQDANNFLLLYRNDGKNFISKINLQEKKIVLTKEIPALSVYKTNLETYLNR